ncbi:hypothetical protein DPMN_137122 [Dreissena polymorpha]|uniref:Uncharacterized protein n=1 Tax=Dreissena polymorpha TaxID=45954 RepID=A0A9D4G1A2_DREPO|nr:hypothetical protein DPMN_137122 [Dreissena polymorpha]
MATSCSFKLMVQSYGISCQLTLIPKKSKHKQIAESTGKLQLGHFNNCTTMTTNICAKVQLAWFGHVTMHDSLYKTVLQGTSW